MQKFLSNMRFCEMEKTVEAVRKRELKLWNSECWLVLTVVHLQCAVPAVQCDSFRQSARRSPLFSVLTAASCLSSQVLGFEVDSINSVQFSNHTGWLSDFNGAAKCFSFIIIKSIDSFFYLCNNSAFLCWLVGPLTFVTAAILHGSDMEIIYWKLL